MNTESNTALGRGWLTGFALLVTAAFATPAIAALPICKTNEPRVTIAGDATRSVADFVPNGSGSWSANVVGLQTDSNSRPKASDGGGYIWTQTGGEYEVDPVPAGTYGENIEFTAPDVTANDGISDALIFKLDVSCLSGGIVKTASASVIVNITDVYTLNHVPDAVAVASEETVSDGVSVTLDGSGSTDADGDALTFHWVQTGGDTQVDLSNANAAITSFTPNTTGNDTLEFRLTVSDAASSSNDDVTVNVIWTNDPPVARLACPLSLLELEEGQAFTLNGSASGDYEDGTNLTYAWSGGPWIDANTPWNGQPNGLPLGDQITSSIDLTAPHLTYGQIGKFTYRLTVTDSVGMYTFKDCAVFVHDVTPPQISVPADFTVDATTSAGATVGVADGYVVSAFDIVDGDLPIVNYSEYFLCAPAPGALFALNATTQVLCNARDSAGNEANEAGFFITVVDEIAPVIAVPLSFAVEAEGPLGAEADYIVKSTDAVDGEQDAVCDPLSGSMFPINSPGPDTTVTCNAVDAHNNPAAEKSFRVTVYDSLPPIFDASSVSPDLTPEADSPQGATVAFALPTATDLVDLGNVTVSCSPSSPHLFPLDVPTLVTCDASDTRSNSTADEDPTDAQPGTSATFTVTVGDTTPPVFTDIPADKILEAESSAGAFYLHVLPTATDVVDLISPVTCTYSPALATASVFPLGETLVTCDASDTRGNSTAGDEETPATSATFKVTVVDTTPPVFSNIPVYEPLEAESADGTPLVHALPTATDAVDGVVGTVTCTYSPALAIPAVFPLGETLVTCNASDTRGNSTAGDEETLATSAVFSITVRDTTAPQVRAPDDVGPVEATGLLSFVEPGTAIDSDLVGVTSRSNTVPPESKFPLGATTITWYATDAAGNIGSDTSTVTVIDTTAPTLTGGSSNQSHEATSAAGATVSWTAPTASDLVDGPRPVSCTHTSPSTFPIGTTTVTCSASDLRPLTASKSFTVTVVDTTAPDLSLPVDIVKEATSSAGDSVTFLATADDLVDGEVDVTCTPASGSTFLLADAPTKARVTTVSCDATDKTGNTASGSFKVTVQDTTAPTIDQPDNLGSIDATGSDGAFVSYTSPATHDDVDGNDVASCAPLSDTKFPLGTTTVTCTAVDARKNVAESVSFDVVVHYPWSGFFRPVDNLPAENVVKAGSGIPVKFSLGGNMGSTIFIAGYPKPVSMTCGSTVVDEIEETVPAGNSSLTYDVVANQYIYVWKTDKAWAGTCRQLQLKLADGTTKVANFKFTR